MRPKSLQKSRRIAALVIGLISLTVSIQHFLHENWKSEIPTDKAIRIPETYLKELSPGVFSLAAGESDVSFASRMNKIIFDHTYHCKPTDFTLSWIQLLSSKFFGGDLNTQGILDRDNFRCGLCHQRAALLTEILRDNQIKARLLGLNGHVVTEFVSAGKTFYSDPDYGVGPFAVDLSVDGIISAYQEVYPFGIGASNKETAESLAELRRMTDMYVTIEDNAEYEYQPFMNKQERLFKTADLAARILFLLGAVVTYLFYPRRKRAV